MRTLCEGCTYAAFFVGVREHVIVIPLFSEDFTGVGLFVIIIRKFKFRVQFPIA